MGAEKGKRARISFTCTLADGTPCGPRERSSRNFVFGNGEVPPALEQGVAGMVPGEERLIRVPAIEATPFLAALSHPAKKGPPGYTGYEFGPGEGGDVLLTVPPPPLHPVHDPPPSRADVLFRVTLTELEDSR